MIKVECSIYFLEMLNSLMDETGRWHMEVIDDVFNSGDAELIKRVPLPLKEKNDSWFWLLDDDKGYLRSRAQELLQVVARGA